MQKFTLYILILVAVAGLFNPTRVSALHGAKLLSELNKYQLCRHQGNTHDQCKGWTGAPKDDPGIDQVAPSAGPSEYEICIRDFGQYNEVCKKLPGAPVYNTLTPSASTPAPVDLKYTLLAPLPCKVGDVGCETIDGKLVLKAFDPTDADNAFGRYLNLMIGLFIGICAVLAVIMIVMGGIEYMTSELVSSKAAGKERIKNAIFGLILALGAWTILNQINPDLLDVSLKNLKSVTVEVIVKEFKISGSGALSRDGRNVDINFNTEAYPAAVNAQTQTGVDAALILAVFNQETTSGVNVGKCFPYDDKTNMTNEDRLALAQIVGKDNVKTTPVSCGLSKDRGGARGGAIGLTQFLPSTWNEIKNKQDAKTIFGNREPDPWNTDDALMMTALYLKGKGGETNEQDAACKYMSGNVCNDTGTRYANEVMAKKDNLQKQINKAKEKGEIS